MFHYEYPATDVQIGFGTGVEWMIMKFKNGTDFESLSISLQHAGRMLSPEIKDSTYKLTRYAFVLKRQGLRRGIRTNGGEIFNLPI